MLTWQKPDIRSLCGHLLSLNKMKTAIRTKSWQRCLPCVSFLLHKGGYVHVCACSVVSDSLQPCGLKPGRLLCPWDFPGKNTGVHVHFLLQGIFPAQGLNLCLVHLLHWQWILLPLCHLGSTQRRLRSSLFSMEVFWYFILSPQLSSTSSCVAVWLVKFLTIRGTWVERWSQKFPCQKEVFHANNF